MKYGFITIDFQHYWHCGSGQAGEGDVDLVPVLEKSGLPYIPGRTLRGRLKWSARELGWPQEQIDRLFGKGNARTLDEEGRLRFTNATMRDRFATACREYHRERKSPKPEVGALFEDIASTKLLDGLAEDRTLRRVRYVVPVALIAEVEAEDETCWDLLGQLCSHLKAIGKGKHDGFGWCSATLSERELPPAPARSENAAVFQIDIELLDDVVISVTSATTGHTTLDYIPGAALMGAAARNLFARLKERKGALALALGKISFGNGTPAMRPGTGTVSMPLSLYHAKEAEYSMGGKLLPGAVSNFAKTAYEESDLKRLQAVQIRGGWLDQATGRTMKPARTQTLKTAVDTDVTKYETAEKAALFGYEALAAGSRFCAGIEVDGADAELCEVVRETFGGRKIRLGRSKGTEFGRARCTLSDAGPTLGSAENGGSVMLLALSDLALVDKNGFPTLYPDPVLFGLGDGWHLDEERTHLRFRYFSQWNAKRGAPDLERQVISKGSVMVFTGPAGSTPPPSTRVGLGQAEGLGRVQVQPMFLSSKTLCFSGAERDQNNEFPVAGNEPAFVSEDISEWIKERHETRMLDLKANALATKWCGSWGRAPGKVSASQWGRLEECARVAVTVEQLEATLGDGRENRATIFGHGRMREKWNVGNPENSLAGQIRRALQESRTEGDRLSLAAFRVATRRMASEARRDRK